VIRKAEVAQSLTRDLKLINKRHAMCRYSVEVRGKICLERLK
jgi:hypothetical protein